MFTKITKALSVMLAVLTLMCIVSTGNVAYAATPISASSMLSGKLDGDLNHDVGVINPVVETNAVSSSDEAKIWSFLYSKIGNAYGTAGVMGNLYAESALISNNLQNSYESYLGYTDASYTAAVDNGTYNNFVYDSAGYGLAQWTYYTRKQNLLNYARQNGKSIGNLDMQLGFLWKELTESYSSLVNTLRSANSVRQASDAVLTQFERPADTSETVKTRRASFGQTYYDRYAQTSTPTPASSFSTNFRMKSGAYTNAYSGVNGSKVGRVYPGDVITVKTVYSSGWMQISCPWTGGTNKIVYVKISEFKFNATQYINAYSGVNGTKVGRVYPNDLVTVIEIYSSGWMKCNCPWGNTTKIIYIKTSEIY